MQEGQWRDNAANLPGKCRTYSPPANSTIWSGPVEAGDGAAASNGKVREALENLCAAPMVLMHSLLVLLSCTAMRPTWRALCIQLLGTVELKCDGV